MDDYAGSLLAEPDTSAEAARPADPDWADPDWADPDEPDWADPFYAEALSASERLAVEGARRPGGRDSSWLALQPVVVLSASDRLELLTILEQQVRWLQAAQARVLAAIDSDDASSKKYSQESVSLALMIPIRTAQNRLKQSRTLVQTLTATLGKLAAGHISQEHARTLTEATWRLGAEPDLAPALEEAVLDRADAQTNAQFRTTVRRAAIRIDPAAADERHQRAMADRSVGMIPAEDGMMLLPVLLDAPRGRFVHTRLTELAHGLGPTDPRTIDQRRADLLVDAVAANLPDGCSPQTARLKPTINVVVSADTLLELGDEPAHLTGYGPITAETARRLAADESAVWRRLLTEPDTGELLDISQDTYRPSARLRRFIAARDDVCSFPTCNQPAHRCEFDHIQAFLSGGKTCRCNGALACRRHNQCKVDSDWSYGRNPDGSFTWRSPEGKPYTSAPLARWSAGTTVATDGEASPINRPIPRRSAEELRLAEDVAYNELCSRWRTERKAAKKAGDRVRKQVANEALAAARRTRTRILAHRRDPAQPPY